MIVRPEESVSVFVPGRLRSTARPPRRACVGGAAPVGPGRRDELVTAVVRVRRRSNSRQYRASCFAGCHSSTGSLICTT